MCTFSYMGFWFICNVKEFPVRNMNTLHHFFFLFRMGLMEGEHTNAIIKCLFSHNVIFFSIHMNGMHSVSCFGRWMYLCVKIEFFLESSTCC